MIEVIHQLIVATVLAIVPYLLIRGPVTRIVGRFPRHDNVTCYQEKQDVNENQQIADKANAQATRSTSEQAADPRVDLAVQRTELALDRTQLAWVRTAFTLITAGFAIDKGAEALHEARVLAGTNWVSGGHAVGITLSAASTLFLLIASALYYQQARALGSAQGCRTALVAARIAHLVASGLTRRPVAIHAGLELIEK